jgi:RNA polymerase sigma-70 factor, ECF subfamily
MSWARDSLTIARRFGLGNIPFLFEVPRTAVVAARGLAYRRHILAITSWARATREKSAWKQKQAMARNASRRFPLRADNSGLLGGCMQTSVSLLDRLRSSPQAADWQRLDAIYRPLIQSWLARDPKLGADADDIVQEVMHVLIRELPGFQRERNGSFRRWLRTVTAHRVLACFRSRHTQARALGGSLEDCPLAQLKDPNSELSVLWDQEHDRFVLRRLLELVEPQFESTTLAAFRRLAFDGIPAKQAASELGVSLNAVLLAKSRVLSRLRQESNGLID